MAEIFYAIRTADKAYPDFRVDLYRCWPIFIAVGHTEIYYIGYANPGVPDAAGNFD